MRSRRVVEEEPSVSVRRRTVRTYEENEPSESVRSRTTVRSGVNVERNSSSTSIRRESSDTNVPASTRQRTNAETTSNMETSSGDVKANASGSGEAGGNSRLLRRQGGQGGTAQQ